MQRAREGLERMVIRSNWLLVMIAVAATQLACFSMPPWVPRRPAHPSVDIRFVETEPVVVGTWLRFAANWQTECERNVFEEHETSICQQQTFVLRVHCEGAPCEIDP